MRGLPGLDGLLRGNGNRMPCGEVVLLGAKSVVPGHRVDPWRNERMIGTNS